MVNQQEKKNNYKNILYIKNYINSKDIDYLNELFNVNTFSINSNKLIGLNKDDLDELINNYDIIIIGGGPQHIITTEIFKYPEIPNQIELIRIISNTNKLLIGICLGCQIIGKAFGLEVIQMDKLCAGFDNLDSSTLNTQYIKVSLDKYLSKLDYDLLSKSFNFHNDCVQFLIPNTELINICNSKNNIPYIIAHTKANIYGFQFHPEADIDCVKNMLEKYDNDLTKNIIETNQDQLNLKSLINSQVFPEKSISIICLHFFNVFINC